MLSISRRVRDIRCRQKGLRCNVGCESMSNCHIHSRTCSTTSIDSTLDRDWWRTPPPLRIHPPDSPRRQGCRLSMLVRDIARRRRTFSSISSTLATRPKRNIPDGGIVPSRSSFLRIPTRPAIQNGKLGLASAFQGSDRRLCNRTRTKCSTFPNADTLIGCRLVSPRARRSCWSRPRIFSHPMKPVGSSSSASGMSPIRNLPSIRTIASIHSSIHILHDRILRSERFRLHTRP